MELVLCQLNELKEALPTLKKYRITINIGNVHHHKVPMQTCKEKINFEPCFKEYT